MSRPVKRSLTLGGHRTSVSLEDEFWQAFREIAVREGKGLNELASTIDAARAPETGLATALRLFVLADLRRRVRMTD
ncbi:ribbon-helix-helix domain-containing protein [Phaeovulum sp. NW3]|uniref:ribbon-helix-helix domain-containing protein n=1 Tax=Phaeovulum sp. NW3 TaxID=2934933 RepID=UPI0020217E17|nr:ribbon-helix-helix domain-containing protein [Phaeovulum sp. NW3]MCL7466409.1 ribbon-helix-helix domain-containing protein [Phaeovulum sp. NW3]